MILDLFLPNFKRVRSNGHRKPGKLYASTKGSQSCCRTPANRFGGGGSSCHDRGLERRTGVGQQFHLVQYMTTTTGQVLDNVGDAGVGEGLETWWRLVLEFDPRAKTKAAGLMIKLLAFRFTRDTASSELCCLRLKQVTGIDIHHGVKKAGCDTVHAIRYVEASLDHACEQVGHVPKGPRVGAGHRQSQRGRRRCDTHADRCSERQGWQEGQGRRVLRPNYSQRSGKFLQRTVEFIDGACWWKLDHRHVQECIEELGLAGGKAALDAWHEAHGEERC